jgi:hypothetical protein
LFRRLRARVSATQRSELTVIRRRLLGPLPRFFGLRRFRAFEKGRFDDV